MPQRRRRDDWEEPEEGGKDLSFEGQGIEDGKETGEGEEYGEIGRAARLRRAIRRPFSPRRRSLALGKRKVV